MLTSIFTTKNYYWTSHLDLCLGLGLKAGFGWKLANTAFPFEGNIPIFKAIVCAAKVSCSSFVKLLIVFTDGIIDLNWSNPSFLIEDNKEDNAGGKLNCDSWDSIWACWETLFSFGAVQPISWEKIFVLVLIYWFHVKKNLWNWFHEKNNNFLYLYFGD